VFLPLLPRREERGPRLRFELRGGRRGEVGIFNQRIFIPAQVCTTDRSRSLLLLLTRSSLLIAPPCHLSLISLWFSCSRS
jgi:hypothetical protein